MGRISDEVEIAASAQAVWALLEDVRRLPEFSTRTLEVKDAPARIAAPGESYVQVGKVLGKRYESRWTVTDFDAGSLIRSEGSVGGGVTYALTQHLTSLGDDRCRLRIDMDYTVPGGPLGRLAARAGLEGQATKEVGEVLRGIRSVAEQGSAG